ncbi:uncharacterized protein LOC141607913 [Silene latifolia]|uniref:uncharacterized protein LOC141607913 n=1 Tax=Silene latifolia TaxID=37657 RepID=UPI003D77AEBE
MQRMWNDFCPCVKCGNNEYVDAVELKSHLLCNGIDKSYTRWIWHGEDVLPTMCSNLEDDSNFEGDDFDENYDRVDDLINDLKQSTEDPTEIESLKAKNGWSDKSFTSLLELLGKILPDGNELPRRTYDAKKILCPMGVDYRKYLMMSLLISGPRQPGNDIDVYLEPLIDDLKLLWDEGVEVYDAYRRETFNLRAMIFCTINDFPAYGNLSGYLVKGAKACPFVRRIRFRSFSSWWKECLPCNRRMLRRSHPYRKKMKPFNGKQELRNPPKILSGKEVYEKVKNIENNFGKPYKRTNNGTLYKKKSIFWDLPY